MASGSRQSQRLKKLPKPDSSNDLDHQHNIEPPAAEKKAKRPRANTTSNATSASKKVKRQQDPEPVSIDEDNDLAEVTGAMEIDSDSDKNEDTPANIRPRRKAATKAKPAVVTSTRRSHVEVLQAVNDYDDAKRGYAKLKRLKKVFIAGFEAEQAEAEQEEEANAVMTLSQQEKVRATKATHRVKGVSRSEKAESTTDEDPHVNQLDNVEDDDFVNQGPDRASSMSGDSESESESERDSDDFEDILDKIDDGVAPPKREKKAMRGETRAEIDALKEEIVALKSKLGGKESKRDVAATDNKQKLKKAPVNHTILKRSSNASGLSAAWEEKSKTSKPVVGSSSRKPAKSGSDIEVLGGFDDDNVASNQPQQAKKKGGKRALKNVIEIESDTEPSAPPKVKGKARERAPKRERVKAEKVKMEPDLAVTKTKHDERDRREMPAFLDEDSKIGLWQAKVLPSLYHTLAVSVNPFTEFGSRSSSLLASITRILDNVAPYHTYQPSVNSKIMEKGYNRLTEKRSQVGSKAMKVIGEHFAQQQFKKNPAAIKAYKTWALHPRGPALWKTYIPEDLKVAAGWKPQGLFESEFVIRTLAPLLNAYDNAPVNYGPPVGAVALAATAVERAFKLYKLDQPSQLAPKTQLASKIQFSHENYGATLLSYLKDTQKISVNGWGRIRAACQAINGMDGDDSEGEDEAPQKEDFSLERARGNMWIASSPPPGAEAE